MVGGVITVNGLVLLVQNTTDRFDTWAYAWTLVFLAGPGVGRWLVGVVRGRGDLVAGGGRLVAAGLAGFGVLGVFFEVVVGIGGRGYGAPRGYALAVLLIVAGLVLVGRRLLAASRPVRSCLPWPATSRREPCATSSPRADYARSTS